MNVRMEDEENEKTESHRIKLVKDKLSELVEALQQLEESEKTDAFSMIEMTVKSIISSKTSEKIFDVICNSCMCKNCQCNGKGLDKKELVSDKIYHNFNCQNIIESSSNTESLSCPQITIPDHFFNLPETAYKVSDFPENLPYEGLEKELEKLESYTPYLDLSQKAGDVRSHSLLANFERTKSSYKEDEEGILDLCSRETTGEFKQHWRSTDHSEFSTDDIVSIEVNKKENIIETELDKSNVSSCDPPKSAQIETLTNLSETEYETVLSKNSNVLLEHYRKEHKCVQTSTTSESILALEKMFPKDVEQQLDAPFQERVEYLAPKDSVDIEPTSVSSIHFNGYKLDSNNQTISLQLGQEALNLINRKKSYSDNSCSDASKPFESLLFENDKGEKASQKVPLSCRSCHLELEDISLFNDHQIACFKTFVCIYCQSKHPNKISFLKHISGHKRNTCQHCDLSFASFKQLKSHIKTSHNMDLVGKTYSCNFCKRIFRKKRSLFYHYQTHAVADEKVCVRCGKFLPNESVFDEHMRDHVKKALKCTICNEIFMRTQQLQAHIKTHEKYKCEHCEKAFSNKVVLHKHSIGEHGQKPKHVKISSAKYFCDKCGKGFHRPSSLNIHMKLHTDEKLWECQLCDKSYRGPRGLMKHLKGLKHEYKSLTHQQADNKTTSNLAFRCQYCDLSMPSLRLLEMHCTSTHSRGVTETCVHCDFKTNKKSLYKKHMATHRERRFICEVCGKAFLNHATLKEHHAFVHSEERNFKCNTCPKSFKNKSTLVRHTKTHVLERPYRCMCGAAFKELFHLRRHKQSAHVDNFNVKKSKKSVKPKTKSTKEAKVCIVEPNERPNDYLVTPISAVVMAGDSTLNNESTHFTVLDSQLIQLVPSNIPNGQDGLHALSLVNGEIHTLSIPSYPMSQTNQESFMSDNLEHAVITPHQLPYQQLAITDLTPEQSKISKDDTHQIEFTQGPQDTILTYSYAETEGQTANTDEFGGTSIRSHVNSDFEILASIKDMS